MGISLFGGMHAMDIAESRPRGSILEQVVEIAQIDYFEGAAQEDIDEFMEDVFSASDGDWD